MAIHFFSEEIKFTLREKLNRKRWLKKIATNAGFKIKELNYVFCSDEYLYQMNRDYLKHDSYTDIITFDNSEVENTIEGVIYDILNNKKQIFQTVMGDNIDRAETVQEIMSLIHSRR